MSDLSHEVDISKFNVPLHIKFALICLNKTTFPKWLGTLCFVLSHLQFIALIIKSVYLALDDNTPSSSPAIRLFIKLFVIGDWLSQTNTAPIKVGIVSSTIYTLKVLGFMVYIHFGLFTKRKIPDLVQKYWGVLHSLHPLILFFWIHTFCMEIILDPPEVDGVEAIRAIAYINVIVNGLLAGFFSIISTTYKTQDVLSTKTNLLETKMVIFKIIIPTLWKTAENSQGMQIFVLVLTLLGTVLHDWIFVKYLPYYRVRILLLSSVFQGIQTSLALTGLIVKLVEAGGADIGIFTFQIVSVLLIPLAIKLNYSETWKLLLYIFGCEIKDEKNIYYSVHKRFILLYFLKSRKAIHGGIKEFSFADIMYQARLAKIVMNSDESLSIEKLDKDKKLLIRSLKVICLEILRLHPRALLAQINLAYSYSKFEDLYLVSNNLLEDAIYKRPGYHAQISLNMIRLELQKKFKLLFSQKTEEGLNIDSYVINQELYDRLKHSIREQSEMQLSFWAEFMSNKPQMMNLVNIAFKVNNQRKIIRRLWNSLMKIRPDSFSSPLVIYGMYCSFNNNNSVDGEKYLEQSQEKAKWGKKILKGDELDNQTIFSDKTVIITMSGLKSKIGKITDYSTNVVNFYGWQRSDMKGRPVISLMPPFYRQRHDGFLQNHFSTGKTKIMNTTLMIPVKRANGYIHPSWIHVKVSPLMDVEMSYVGLLKPSRASKRMVLVRKDGKIDDMSFEFAKDMNLTRKEDQYETNIVSLCPEFRQINQAFNIIAENSVNDVKTEKAEAFSPNDNDIITPRNQEKFNIDAEETVFPQMENNKAQVIYDKFMKGSTLEFHPQNQVESITYNVKISNSIHGKDFIKFVLLEKFSGGDDGNFTELTNEQEEAEAVLSSFPTVPNKNWVSSPRIETQISPSAWDTEGAELIGLATSPRGKAFESLHDETHLSILNEVQNGDSAMRETIARNIFFQKKNSILASYPRKTPIDQTPNTELLTEQTERNLLTDRRKKRAQTHLLVVSKKQKPKEQSPQKLKQGGLVENVAQIENSVASTSISKGKKAEQLVIRALKGEPKKRSASIFTFSFLVFLALMVILLIVQNVNLRVGIRDVQSQFPVISAGFFRQFNMIYTALEILQLEGLYEGKYIVDTFPSDNSVLTGYLEYYLVRMKARNSQFYELLNKLPADMQSKFYEKNVGIYESDENSGNKTLIGMFTTFDAFGLMIEKGDACLNMELPDQYEDGIDVSNHRFILDNTLNDLLIESQNQNIQLTYDLEDSTSSTTVRMEITAGISLAACLIFTLISVRYLWVIAREARIFMIMIFRIKLAECEAMQAILENFVSALDAANMKKGDFLVSKKEKIVTEDQQNNSTAFRFRRASMSSFYQSQRRAFIKLLPIYSLFICWSVVYFFLAFNFTRGIQDSETRMEASLQALSNQAILVYGLAGVPLNNGTGTIKNKPVITDYLERLDDLQEVDRFVNTFRDQNGKLTPLQQKVLYDFPCDDLLSMFGGFYAVFYSSCVSVSKGAESFGLVKINSGLYTAASYALQLYEESNKTKEELENVYLTGLGMCGAYVSVAEGFLKMLYDATNESFEDDVDFIKKGTLFFTIFIVIGTGIATLVTWHLVLKKVFRAQKIDWFILQLIPVKLILGNKHIQQYLLRHSDGMFDGVKNFI